MWQNIFHGPLPDMSEAGDEELIRALFTGKGIKVLRISFRIGTQGPRLKHLNGEFHSGCHGGYVHRAEVIVANCQESARS